MSKLKKAKRILAGLLAFSLLASACSSLGMVTAGAAGEQKADYLHAFPIESYAVVSDRFELTVDGEPVEVASYFNYSGKNYRYSYAHLAYEGTATFTVKAKGGDITEYNISPHSYGIEASVSGNTLTFTMEQKNSRYLIMDVTAGGTTDQLIVACDPKLELEKPVVDGKTVIDITKAPYNADNTGATLLTPKNPTAANPNVLQQAIDDLSAAGGGTLYFPAGEYQFTYLYAKDNVTLWLDEGAALHGTTKRTEYTFNDSGQNGRQGPRNIQLQNAKNFSILGYGVVDANQHKIAMPKGQAGAPVTDDPQPDNWYPSGWDDFRTGIVDANGAENIRFEGVTFKDATGWTFNITNSTNVDIYNVKMLNDYAIVHSDGYDLVTCQNVNIIDCLGICGDDVFCPKAANSNREMKNYLIKDGVAYARGGAGCKVGVQSSAKTSNIEFNNIDVVQGYRAFSISHDEGTGAWSDIRFIDIRCEKLWVENSSDSGQYRPAAFIIWTLSRGAAPVSNIEVTNCSIENTYGLKGVIKGETAAGVVSNVRFSNLMMDGMTINRANAPDKLDISGNVVSDTVTFDNTEYKLPTTVRYEMEGATFANNADDNAAAGASCGRVAGNLGGNANGTATIRFIAEKAGLYELEVFHCSGQARTLGITVGGKQTTLTCPSTGSYTANPMGQKVTLQLEKGENQIVFGGVNNGWAPNLDRVEISALPIEEVEAVEELVFDIGRLPAADKIVKTHERRIKEAIEAYNTLSNSQMAMVSNVDKLIAAVDAITALGVKLPEMNPLDANPDELIPIGPAGPALPIDPITGEKEVYEAEEAEVIGTQEIVDIVGGGKTVNSVGYNAETGTQARVEFKVKSEVPGARTMEIFYITNASRDVRVTVNGKNAQTITCAGNNTDWNATIASVRVRVDLVAGENVIVLDNPTGWAPNLDRIEIEVLKLNDSDIDPNAKKVMDAINALGTITSLDQEAQVIAAREAYDGLTDSAKKWISDELLAKLTAAEAAIETLKKALPGDVDGDGNVNVSDIIKVKNLIMAGTWSEAELLAGDMNNSGKLDVADIIAIKNQIMGE